MQAVQEQLKIGGLQIRQPRNGYRFSVDAILLADFVRVKTHERLIDLGTGSGIIPLLVSAFAPVRIIVGLEIQEQLAVLARENVRLNHLEDRITIVRGDLKHVAQTFQAGEFDVVCSNPPYRKVGAGRLNPHNESAIARHELTCQLSDLAEACKYLVKPGGKVFVIYLAERLGELISQVRQHNLEPNGRLRGAGPRQGLVDRRAGRGGGRDRGVHGIPVCQRQRVSQEGDQGADPPVSLAGRVLVGPPPATLAQLGN